MAILFNIVQRSNMYVFRDGMNLHIAWGKGCKLYRYRTYRYHAYWYGCIVLLCIGMGGILDRFLIAHIKDSAYIYVLSINSTIT
jgi:hypothetical protein